MKLKAVFCVLLLTLVLAVGVMAAQEKVKVRVWGPLVVDRSKGWEAAVKEFERRNPGVKVEMLSMGAGGMNPQKLLTAIVGEAPPDIVYQDRFTVADWASRDTLTPLDSFIARDRNLPDGVRKEDYYPAAWNETIFKNKVYGIPTDIDDRVMFYNKKMFREAGLDPENPPKTWSELELASDKLTKKTKTGFDQIGFIPNFGNSWFYLYSWQMGGKFMSDDLRTCTFDNPRSLAALEWMIKFYNRYEGIETLNSFVSGFSGLEFDPFMTGKIAMRTDCVGLIGLIARYHPNLDFGVCPAPIPDDRYYQRGYFKNIKDNDRFVTWSGGFSYVIPRGAKHSEEAWAFIKWMTSEEGVDYIMTAQKAYNLERKRPFVPWFQGNRVVNEAMLKKFAPAEKKYADGLKLGRDMLPASYYRPTTTISQRLWNEHDRAFQQAVYGKATPSKALKEADSNVQKALDKYFERGKYPILNWNIPIAIAIAVCIILAVICFINIRKQKLSKIAKGEMAAALVCASPWLFGFLVFTLGPILVSFVYSLCDYDVLHPARWVGISNYIEMFGKEEWYYVSKSMYNAFYLGVFGIPLGLITSLCIALLLNMNLKGMTWYRTIYYLPSVMPVVATAVLWTWMLNPEYGLINAFWKSTIDTWFGIHPPAWLAAEATAKPALILMGLWGAGGGMILWLAGLQGVSKSLYEAAEIDGANSWTRFWKVTVPMLTPYIFFNLIMGVIGVLQSFDTQFIMTAGGPVEATLVPVLYLFNRAFGEFRMGYASAVAWLLFLIVFILTIIQLKLANKWVYYEGGDR